MSGGAFGEWVPSPWAAMSRPRCAECRTGEIRWCRSADLPWHVRPGDRLRAFELIGWVGQNADAWYCVECIGFGAFDSEPEVYLPPLTDS